MKKLLMLPLLVFIISICFNVNKVSAMNEGDWNLYFENINITEGSVNAIQAPIITEESATEITYSVDLNIPGEFYEFTVDVKNAGTLDAMIKEININQLTAEQEKYLKYEVTYNDGTEIKPNDRLNAGETHKLKVRLEFKRNITADDLPTENATLTLSVNTYYVPVDENAEDTENENIVNNTDNTDNSVSENNNNTVSKSEKTKNAKTGDNIVTYILILSLAIFALLVLKIKTRKEE